MKFIEWTACSLNILFNRFGVFNDLPGNLSCSKVLANSDEIKIYIKN